jgi:hypothetical protein
LLSTPLYRLSARVKYRKKLKEERMIPKITTYQSVSLNFMVLNHIIPYPFNIYPTPLMVWINFCEESTSILLRR